LKRVAWNRLTSSFLIDVVGLIQRWMGLRFSLQARVDAYLDLADELAKRTSTDENADVRKYFRRLSKAMYSWVKVCQAIL